MVKRILPLTALATIGLAPLGALADATPAPSPAASSAPHVFRHLSYTVNVGIRTTDRSMNFGGSASFGGGSTATGDIDADVLGLAPGNTLVFRVAEHTDNRKAPPVTLGVMNLGQIRSDPKDAQNLNEEELQLLSMLGRGVIADHDLATGSTWKVENGADAKNSDTTTYTVQSLVGDTEANVNFERAVKVSGVQPFDVEYHGKMLYDFKRSIPLSATVMERVHQEGATQTTTDMSFEYKLAQDSLAK